MRDVLGWRCKFGVIGPSTNTIVQPDFDMMRPPGVTNHYRGIFTPNNKAVSNETFMAGAHVIGGNVLDAVKQRHDLRARLPGHGHVGGDVFRRRGRRRRVPGQGRKRSRRRHQHRLAFLAPPR